MTRLLLITAAVYSLCGLAIGYLCYRASLRGLPPGIRLDRYDRWSVAFCGACWPLVLAALAADLVAPDSQGPPLLLAVGLLLVLVALALQTGLR